MLIHLFIHSELIAPLQGSYSEALLMPTCRKRTVLSLVRKDSDRVSGCRCSSKRRSFQTTGPTTEKARFFVAAVRANGTKRIPLSTEHRGRRPWIPEVRQNSSQM